MKQFKLTYKPFGNTAILIEWPQQIAIDILNDIRLFVSEIENENYKEILELNYVYNSLLIRYNYRDIHFTDLKNKLKLLYTKEFSEAEKVKNTLWELPVCYDLEFGVDLPFLALEKGMHIDEIISLHTSIIYTVYGIGFLPGFLYLGGLPKKLHFPRRETPRFNVPKGAVAIGGNQTGIYPQTSPGGWQIIGRTPVLLFNIKKDAPSVISPGDKICFKPISRQEFADIELEEEDGNYELKKRLN